MPKMLVAFKMSLEFNMNLRGTLYSPHKSVMADIESV